jgi:PAS domain-containing protein
MRQQRVLIVADGRDTGALEGRLRQGLGAGHELFATRGVDAACEDLTAVRFGAVILLAPPNLAAAEAAVRRLAETALGAPVLALVAAADEDAWSEALARAGALECVGDHPAAHRALGRLARNAIERTADSGRALQILKERRDSERLLSKLLSVVNDGIVVVEEGGRLLLHNTAAAGLIDGLAAAVAGRPLGEMLPPDVAAALLAREAAGQLTVKDAGGQRRTLRLRRVQVTIGAGRRCEVVGLAPIAEPASAGPPAGPAEPERRVVQLVWLGGVRERLGARWPELEAKVRLLCESIIEREIGRGDRFLRTDSGDYLLTFARVSEEEAWRRAEAIRDKIAARLLGEAGRAPLEEADAIRALEVGVSRVALEPEEGKAAAGPEDREATLRRAAARGRRSAQEGADRLIEEVAGDARCSLLGVLTRQGTAAPMARAVLARENRRRLSEIRFAIEADDALAARVDEMLLEAATDLLDLEAGSGAGQPVIIDVRFSTLQKRPLRESYLARLRAGAALTAPRLVPCLARIRTTPTRSGWPS